MREEYQTATLKQVASEASESRHLLRQQVAEDMHHLIKLFVDNTQHNGKDTYKALERIFYGQ